MTVELVRRGQHLERALELAEELEVHVGGAELVVAGQPSAITAFAGALVHAGFEVSRERRLQVAAAVPIRERVAERDGLTLRLRTV